MRRSGIVAALAAVALVTAGCSGPQGGPPASSWSRPATPAATTAPALTPGRALVPTGLRPVGGGSGDRGLVVDGAGAVWVEGPWQVARIDPTSGAASVWSAADDAAFGTVTGSTGSVPAGVWLAAADHVLRFDGTRFAEDLAVPAEYGEFSGPVVAGDRVWISAFGGTLVRGTVLEWRDGSWAEVGRAAGPLAVDGDGALWSGSSQLQPDGSWVTPDPSNGPDEGQVAVSGVDAAGGLWCVSGADLYHFDGVRWTYEPLPGVPVVDRSGGGWYPSSLAVAPDGEVWLAGAVAVLRRGANGGWTTYTAEQGIADTLGIGTRDVAVTGDEVLVSDATGALRLVDGAFVPMWRDPAMDPISMASCLRAASSSAAWVVGRAAADLHAPAADPPPARLARFADGTWHTGGPETTGCDAAVAPDGALWAVTPKGLVRSDGDAWVTVDDAITSGPVAVGPDGVAWALSGNALVRYGPGGRRTVIGPVPMSARPDSLMLTSGRAGVVWVATNAWEAPQDLARWDGAWGDVPNDAWTMDIAATPDGALWAFASDNETGWLLRWADGRWSEVPRSRGQAPAALSVSPTGEVCGLHDVGPDALVCFDADGPTTTSPSPVGQAELSVAPDGSAWVLGQQLARLAQDSLPWSVRTAG